MAHKTRAGRRIIGDVGQVMELHLEIEDDLYKKNDLPIGLPVFAGI